MSKKCPRCESKDIYITEYPVPTDNIATCYGCGYVDLAERFPEQTVFDRITQSPEVLAEKLVYQGLDGDFHSSIIEGGTRAFPYESQAIAATVEKLKAIEKK